jgi:hypothetical protein
MPDHPHETTTSHQARASLVGLECVQYMGQADRYTTSATHKDKRLILLRQVFTQSAIGSVDMHWYRVVVMICQRL